MTYFVFCIHNHQPAGNFDSVIEEAYRKSYLPFLQALSRHPSIKLSLHTTGFLLDWIIKNHPEYVDLLRAMVDSNQVEIMGGGYYEPVLSVIPERDRFRQITLFSDRIEDVFKTRPRGIWLAERVWEPTLPTAIKGAGLEYLVVDDYHFIKSGLTREDLGGYYITEDQGNVIKIFPGSESLRYLIPFKPVHELENHLKGLKGYLKKGNAAIYGDDGEKFGSWPETHKWVFEEGWLDSFFSMIERNLDWLTPLSLGEYLDREEPVGLIYLPTTSYMEMGEWSLPAEASRTYTRLMDEVKTWKDGDRLKRFLQGGIWRNFFSKYPEANWMHKRMLFVSKELSRRVAEEGLVGDLRKAEELLYRAQCNDAYWHGVFGGLYLPHLRTEVYRNLIQAEDYVIGTTPELSTVTVADFDADDHSECLMRTKDLNLFLSPANGGSMVELDFRPKAVNVSNTLTRWREGYHYKLEDGIKEGSHDTGAKSIHDMIKVKEEGLERYLRFDTARRASFVDRFLSEDITMDTFHSSRYSDSGDFHNGRYESEVKENRILLSRTGRVEDKDVSIKKIFKAEGHSSFRTEYIIKSHAPLPGIRFAVEFNLLLPACDGPATFYQMAPPLSVDDEIGLGSSGVKEGVEKVALADTYSGVVITIEPESPATLWRFPVHSVSLSEGGFEKIYQGSCLVFLFPLAFKGGEMNAGFRVRAQLHK